MNKVFLTLVIGLLIISCGTQKTVTLANGKTVTQKKYDRMLNKAFRDADKAARDAVKGRMNRKEIRELKKELTVVTDTTQN